jgi:hypothetical protein
MGNKKKNHPLQREIIQEHHGAHTGVRVNPTPGSPCIQETQNINYVLSLQFTTCDFGFSLLAKERKKERKRGEELKDKIYGMISIPRHHPRVDDIIREWMPTS